MNHDELVRHAANWLRKKKNYPIVIQDVHCQMVSEQPDVLGWKNHGTTALVECKTSTSDLIADREKMFRKRPDQGVGLERWYAFPHRFFDRHPGATNHIPGSWGIVEFSARGAAHVKRMPSFRFIERNLHAEMTLLVNACRKATEGWGRRTFGDIAPPLVDGDPHPTATKIIRELREEVCTLRRRVRDLERPSDRVVKLPSGPAYGRHSPGPMSTEAYLLAQNDRIDPLVRANRLAINPKARVTRVGDNNYGTVDGWIGPRLVRVRWDSGAVTETDCDCLRVLIAASPKA